MALETAGGAALATKIGALFGASAFGAGVISAMHSDDKFDTFWRAMGAGFGGVFIGGTLYFVLSHYITWLSTGRTKDDIFIVLTIAFVVGALFWGLVALLQNLGKKLGSKGAADAVARKVGL